MRILQKYAARVGGGGNHRSGLDDAIIIKDNHVGLAGGVRPAVERARLDAGHMVKIELEVDTLEELEEVLAVGVDAVQLDNMTLEQLRRAATMVAGKTITEACWCITPTTTSEITATGVDLISIGWITHSASTLDIGLDYL
jgi:nicotinate-nucleotide pyrophosphorylase (carboxylating)